MSKNYLTHLAKNLSTKIKMSPKVPLTYKVIAECSTTKARVGVMSLIHSDVNTPVFMPVGTQVNFNQNKPTCFFFSFHNKKIFSGNNERSTSRSTNKSGLSNNFRKYIPFRDETGS